MAFNRAIALGADGAGLGAKSENGATLVTRAGRETLNVLAGLGVRAVLTVAGVAGKRIICHAITVDLRNDGAVAVLDAVNFILRDGAAGVGQIKWSCYIANEAVLGIGKSIQASGLDIIGTSGNAMVLEMQLAPGIHSAGDMTLVYTTVDD